MTRLILLLVFVATNSLSLMACEKSQSSAQLEKQKQQEAADKKALSGKFEKSQGKSY
jgi:hypothetical protein